MVMTSKNRMYREPKIPMMKGTPLIRQEKKVRNNRKTAKAYNFLIGVSLNIILSFKTMVFAIVNTKRIIAAIKEIQTKYREALIHRLRYSN
jgi:uncharacterized protein YybS (DUF2232 family)